MKRTVHEVREYHLYGEGLHVVFHQVDEQHFGPLRLLVPTLSTLDGAAALLATGAMLAMFRFKVGLPKTLAGSALLGVIWKVFLA